MTTLIICGRLDAGRHLSIREKATAITHVVSIGADWDAPPDGFEVYSGIKLRLTFDDVLVTKGSRRAPGEDDIQSLIAFARDIHSPAPTVLVHCGEGQSRGPAAAYVMLCAWMGPGAEEKVAAMVRGLRVGCVPNRRMIELGDEALGRGGAMLRALGL